MGRVHGRSTILDERQKENTGLPSVFLATIVCQSSLATKLCNSYSYYILLYTQNLLIQNLLLPPMGGRPSLLLLQAQWFIHGLQHDGTIPCWKPPYFQENLRIKTGQLPDDSRVLQLGLCHEIAGGISSGCGYMLPEQLISSLRTGCQTDAERWNVGSGLHGHLWRFTSRI